jgi:hypothetical protein
VALQPDGKIVVTGTDLTDPRPGRGHYDFALALQRRHRPVAARIRQRDRAWDERCDHRRSYGNTSRHPILLCPPWLAARNWRPHKPGVLHPVDDTSIPELPF